MTAPMAFRSFLESTAYCDLQLSPLIAAITDAADGVRPAIDTHAHFGCDADELPEEPRRTVVVRAGGRGGKTSRLVAPKAMHAAWTVPLPTLRRGEVASSIIVAPDLKLARQALSFVRGYIEGSKILSRAVTESTKDSITIRRRDGRLVRIEVLAATRGGRALRGRTLVFAGLDEACFFLDEDTGVINDAELYRAVIQRIVPGGQCWIVSTPWIADVGLLESLLAKNFGTHVHALCVTAPTRALNPSWDPTGEIERDMREQDPDAAAREIDAVPMSAGTSAFFDPTSTKSAIDESRALALPRPTSGQIGVGADLAFSSDSSALAIVGRVADAYTLLALEELRPRKGAPLKPRFVIDTFAVRMSEYEARTFTADAHYRESAREHLEPHKIRFDDAPGGRDGKNEAYLLVRKLLLEERLHLPNHARLIAQLRAVVSRPVSGGGFVISSPRRAGGGHGDLVSALVLAVWAASRARDEGSQRAPAFRPYRSQFDDGYDGNFYDDRPNNINAQLLINTMGIGRSRSQ